MSNDKTLRELATLREANEARQREWDKDNQISLAYRGNELAGEVGEACNIIKKLERERLGIAGSRATKEQLAEELADVIICADLIAMDAGIDLLSQAVPAKFNATSEKVGLSTRLAAAHPQAILTLIDERDALRKALVIAETDEKCSREFLAITDKRFKVYETALNSIAHTFTEDSHGNTKTFPASYYQDIARTALRSGGKS